MHPYIPHITESLYSHITDGKVLALSEWPTAINIQDKEAEKNLSDVFEIARTIRNIRAESGVKPGDKKDVIIKSPKALIANIEANGSLLSGLARIETLTVSDVSQKNKHWSYGVIGDYEIFVDSQIDNSQREEEKKRLAEQIEEKKNYLRTLEAKLSNTAFSKNAPEKIVRIEMDKKRMTEEQLQKLEEKYNHIEL